MKYFAGICLLMVGLFVGAHSQPSGSSPCVTSIEVNGKQYFGKIKLVTPYSSDKLPMLDASAFPGEDGTTTIYLRVYPPLK